MNAIATIKRWHDSLFSYLERLTDGWFMGLFARFVFFAVLYFYFLNSFLTKIGDGVFGFLSVQDSAWYQIAPVAVDAAGGDIQAIPFFPWHLIVPLGTYAEFLLPLLITTGLFTRIASAGMIGFITVQTLTDIFGHMVGAETIGALFDRFPDSAIADQRLLWIVPLVYLVLKGGGRMSLDAILARRFQRTRAPEMTGAASQA